MTTETDMKSISPVELRNWKETGKDFQLIDIREDYEVADETIGGHHIRMEEVIARVSELRKDIPVVIHCKSGRRSSAVAYVLEMQFKLDNLYTLEGGISAALEAGIR
ncbi:MAG: rhodanese-like domain-containing protein [Flavobacteriales bacterium]